MLFQGLSAFQVSGPYRFQNLNISPIYRINDGKEVVESTPFLGPINLECLSRFDKHLFTLKNVGEIILIWKTVQFGGMLRHDDGDCFSFGFMEQRKKLHLM
jgi:hypothetical protein